MKILLIYPYFCTPKGSWGTRHYEFGKRWLKADSTLEVISSSYEKSDMPKEIGVYDFEGIKVEIIPFGDNNRLNIQYRMLRSFMFTLITSFKVLTKQYDVLIASSGPQSNAIPMLLAKWIRSKPVVFEVRDLWPQIAIDMKLIKNWFVRSFLLRLEKLTYVYSDLIITLSIGQADHIKTNFKFNRIKTIPNASDLDLFDSQYVKNSMNEAFSKSQPYLVHFGSLGRMNNANYWIDVAKELAEVKFVFIGEGSERVAMEAKVDSLNLRNIEFLGLLPKEELIPYIHNAKASICSVVAIDSMETFSPNKVFDSFAAGLPVIQTTKGWIGELISNENAGINVDPADPSSAANEIKALLNDSNRLAEMSKSAKRLAQTQFDRDKLAKRYLELLEELVDK